MHPGWSIDPNAECYLPPGATHHLARMLESGPDRFDEIHGIRRPRWFEFWKKRKWEALVEELKSDIREILQRNAAG
ncbi:MAG: hypothetical protein AB1714_09700 [Acidobacteriota bacterium]